MPPLTLSAPEAGSHALRQVTWGPKDSVGKESGQACSSRTDLKATVRGQAGPGGSSPRKGPGRRGALRLSRRI